MEKVSILTFNEKVVLLSNSLSKINILLVTFISICFYIFIVIMNINDIDLFITESTIKIPILNYYIKTSQFYIGTPIVVLLLYLTLYSSLKHYYNSIKYYRVSNLNLLPSILMKHDGLSQFLKFVTFVLFPLFISFNLFITFLPYQSLLISIYHFIFFVLMFFVSRLFIVNIIKLKILNVMYLILFTMVSFMSILFYILFNIDNIQKDEKLLNNFEISMFIPFFDLKVTKYSFKIDEMRTHYKNPNINFNFNARKLRFLDFSGSKIHNANFKYAMLKDATFTNSEIDKSEFGGAHLQNVIFNASTISNTNFVGVHYIHRNGISKMYFNASTKENFFLTSFGATKFNNVLLTDIKNLENTNFQNALFKNSRVLNGANEVIVKEFKQNTLYLGDVYFENKEIVK